jgi:DNA-binding response OmpR family regulator
MRATQKAQTALPNGAANEKPLVDSDNLASLIIVEDNPDDSFWLNRELKKANLRMPIKVFADALEAFDFLTQSRPLPAAVFLDLHLPITSGMRELEG